MRDAVHGRVVNQIDSSPSTRRRGRIARGHKVRLIKHVLDQLVAPRCPMWDKMGSDPQVHITGPVTLVISTFFMCDMFTKKRSRCFRRLSSVRCQTTAILQPRVRGSHVSLFLVFPSNMRPLAIRPRTDCLTFRASRPPASSLEILTTLTGLVTLVSNFRWSEPCLTLHHVSRTFCFF
jgi:hypothetical protein